MIHQRDVGFVSNKHDPSVKLGSDACISSRITTVIHVAIDYRINYNCFNEPFAVSPYKGLYLDMHGLIFETSIWSLAGSTRWWLLTSRFASRAFAPLTTPSSISNINAVCNYRNNFTLLLSLCDKSQTKVSLDTTSSKKLSSNVELALRELKLSWSIWQNNAQTR